VCFYDDVIQFGQSSSAALAEYFLPSFQASLRSPMVSVRQAAAYGYNMMATYGGLVYSAKCVGTTIAGRPAARGEEGKGFQIHMPLTSVRRAGGITEALPDLLTIIRSADARSDLNVHATENGARDALHIHTRTHARKDISIHAHQHASIHILCACGRATDEPVGYRGGDP
jgi:hypothetical protein